MDDQDKYHRYANIPIPTYDEATSSRPSSSQNLRGPSEISDDAERQGLITVSHRQPTVESPRSSEDSDLRLPEISGDDDDRRRVEELDYLDPSAPDPEQAESRLYHRHRLRSKFSLSSLGATLSSIRLPSFRSFYTPVSTSTTIDDAPAPPPSRLTWLTRTARSFPRIPEQYRMSAGNAARLCGLLTIGLLIYMLFILDIFPGSGRYGPRFEPESVRAFVQQNVDPARIEEYLRHVTDYDHVAGTQGDLYMAEWMKERWLEEGKLDDIALESYFVYLNYPVKGGRSVSIVSPEEKKWTAILEEEIVDPSRQQTFAWHGSSKSGEVEGHLIYANGGSKEDFDWLREQGVALNGSIALMRYYHTQADRGLKVQAAQDAGCIGALIYSDPTDDGSVRGPIWPDGPWRPEDSLQRGSVAMSGFVVGDPLTPGHASTKDAHRVAPETSPALPQIPSLPLAWRDAKVLLESVQKRGKEVPGDWVGGDDHFPKTWFTGDAGEGASVVHLKNVNEENEKQQIWNLHGLIQGLEQPDKRILVGNHRDAWCFGSVDPGTGSAVLMEMVRIFGTLRNANWRPLRSIEFISWDAEEYNLIGSTEYVEDNMDFLRDNAVAYLNVDVGVYGPDPLFRAAGSPVWQRPLLHVLDRVTTPGNETTLRQVWEERQSQLEGLGAGSDYVAFQDMAGTSSLDFGFNGADSGYPYHSCYESFEWVKKFGDPDMGWHKVLAQVWALLILEVADRPILPFDLRTYADFIKGPYLNSLQAFADQQAKSNGRRRQPAESAFSIKPLREAADYMAEVATEFHKFEDYWTTNVLGAGGMENNHFARQRIHFNNKLAAFETDLLDLPGGPDNTGGHGIPGREQYKHIIFGPETGNGYDAAFFPAVKDALERGNMTQAQLQVDKAAAILRKAVDKLK